MANRDRVPAVPLLPPRVGLLPSLRALGRLAEDTADPFRWGQGITWDAEECDAAGVFDPCDTEPATVPTEVDDRVEEAFGVWAGHRCSALGYGTPDGRADREARARNALLACESEQVAHELWTGTLAQAQGWDNHRLASPASDSLSEAGSVGYASAMALLEQGLADCGCGGRGLIHATRQTVTHWDALGLIRVEVGLRLTVHDTVVVADAGYDGSAPDGTPAVDGEVWAYATGMIDARLSAVEVTASVDRSVNTAVVRAARLAVLQWDACCHLAVPVALTLPDVGGGS